MKIRRHHCKKGLKTRKGPEFDSDLWENNKDIAMQSRKVSRCLYGGGGGGGGRGGGGGSTNLTQQYKHLLNLKVFLCSLQMYHFQTWKVK